MSVTSAGPCIRDGILGRSLLLRFMIKIPFPGNSLHIASSNGFPSSTNNHFDIRVSRNRKLRDRRTYMHVVSQLIFIKYEVALCEEERKFVGCSVFMVTLCVPCDTADEWFLED